MLYSVASLLVCLLVTIAGIAPAAEDHVITISTNVFIANSGISTLSSTALRGLRGTLKQSASFRQIRAFVPLSKEEFFELLKENQFFDWWDSGEPTYEVWKKVVLHDGAVDDYIPADNTTKYHVSISDRYGRTRRLYLLTANGDEYALYYYYISTARRGVMIQGHSRGEK